MGYERATAIHEEFPTCHVVAIAQPMSQTWSMQLLGCRDLEGKSSDNARQIHSTETYQAGDGPAVTFDFVVFDSGRIAIEAGEQVMAFASSSWEKHGTYLFFNQMAPH
ncbi:hypothetical protein OIO90_002700 [Microbotryomycetes sp. JL221]|nr:hypothetical protein OIO90_002700 [Microbotryomycetes sp. JL221]